MLSSEQANAIVDYLETLDEYTRHQTIMTAMKSKGYTEDELDEALKALGKIAGRDCGILL